MAETKALTGIDQFKAQIAHSDMQAQILNYLNRDEDRKAKFISAAIHSVRKVPELLNCDRNTLMDALITCAQFNLYPSAISGEAYILPYKGKAQFQLGYQGMITLLYRAGVQSINAQIVFENDLFEYQEGLEPKLNHAPAPFGTKRGKPIGVYAIAIVNGEKMFKVMSEEEVMAYKEFSQSKGSQYSPWNAKNDPDLWMWKKTAIKQLSKILPKNDTLSEAIGKDNQDSTIALIPDRTYISTEQIMEGAPTTGSLTKKDTHGKKTTEGPETEALFDGVAGNHPRN